MQIDRCSFPLFFSSVRVSFLFHPGLDMCANSALALKGSEAREGLQGLPLVIAWVTGAHTWLGLY